MNTIKARKTRESGYSLISTLIFGGILAVTATSLLRVTASRSKAASDRMDWTETYYHAENGVVWALQKIADASDEGSSASFLGKYSWQNSSLALSYLADVSGSAVSRYQDTWVTIENHPNNVVNLYLVTSSSKVGGKVRTLQVTVRKNPPSPVFDYEYFLNNWGWWWGSTISGWGANRANWDFDFRGVPTVNGSVIANGTITQDGTPVDPLNGSVPFIGLAGSDPVSYVHSGAPRLEMPNLMDFTYYQQKAAAQNGKVQVGTNLVVAAVHTNAVQPGIYLVGTTSNPILIDGPVVISGDLVISGKITGVGTFCVGGNLYVAGDLTYVNGPDYSTPPETMTPSARDAWVQAALNAKKDLVGFAVRESVFGGQVNSAEWKSLIYDPTAYGLRNVGDESNLGEDGIHGTPDDGVGFVHPDGSVSAWYDADGDGVVDRNYDLDQDIKMTDTRAAKITGYPTDPGTGQPVSYDSISTNNMNRIDGIIYCNHAVGMRLAKANMVWNGSVICRNEAIISSSTAKFIYDPRVHSRYSDDPNRFIDLGLPFAKKTMIVFWEEIAPIDGFKIAAVPVK